MTLNLNDNIINEIIEQPFYNSTIESKDFNILFDRSIREIKFIFQDKRLNRYNEFKYVTFRTEKIYEIDYIDELDYFKDHPFCNDSFIGVERKFKYFNNPIECYTIIKTYDNIPDHLKNEFTFYQLYGRKYYVNKKHIKQELNNLYNIFLRRVYKQYTQNTDIVNRFKNQISY
jgi:hypothetical protein